MAVVKNLMIRIGADYSPAKKAMTGASKELTKFRKDTEKTTSTIKGPKGLGGIKEEFRSLGGELSTSISRLRGAKGIGGVATEVKTLIPILGRSSTAMTNLGKSAAGTGGKLARLAGPIGIVAAALGALAGVSGAASQEAVKFEASLGRVNMTLKGGARDFMDWARAQGLAKSSAADMGATYGVLLSSFIKDTKELQTQVTNITQATRVVASATGRSIEDVTERMRSGLLGNTEAIEDLGVFVQVAMLESTDAFKKLANGKSWDQLDFRIQQQIRLAGILEQAYAQYGNTLQNNTMTKQSLFIEQLKNIKLHLSQSFLPIWNAVLPALTRMAEGIANLTEHIARFMYAIRGWDYDEMTRGTDQQTGAVQNQGQAYDDLAKSAAKARGQLAAFDEINQLGDGSGGGAGGGGGSGGINLPGLPSGGGSGGTGGSVQVPVIPPLPKQRLEFEPPSPPDAGAGGVAAAVTDTINGLTAAVKQRLAGMWGDLQTQTAAGAAAQGLTWSNMWSTLQTLTTVGAEGQNLTWSNMWSQLLSQTGISAPVIQSSVSQMFNNIGLTSSTTTTRVALDWKTMLTGMLTNLVTYRPSIETNWNGLKLSIESIKTPLTTARTEWNSALNYMQVQLNAYRPYLEWGWKLLGIAVSDIKSPLAETKTAWSSALSEMYSTAASKLGSIVGEINGVVSAWNNMQVLVSGKAPTITGPVVAPKPSPVASPAKPVTSPAPDSSLLGGFQTTFSKDNLANMGSLIQKEASKPQNQAAVGVLGTILPVGKVGGALAKYGDDAVKGLMKLWDGLKGTVGNAVPAFANGGMVYGPTLAMVGDNPRAAINPEIIAPKDDIVDIIQTAVANAVAATQVNGGGRQGDVVLQVDGVTFARLIGPYTVKESARVGGSMIRTT